MSRLLDALQRAHAVREQNRMGLRADAPACRLEEAPLPPVAAFDPALETGDLDRPRVRHEAKVRAAIFTAAGLALAILIGWYLLEAREPPPQPKPSVLKLEQQLSPRK